MLAQSQTIRRAVTSIDEVEFGKRTVRYDEDSVRLHYRLGKLTLLQNRSTCLIHPTAVITPISYEFAKLDPPSAGSEGKWDYFEESFEDVFVLPNKVNAIAFNVEA